MVALLTVAFGLNLLDRQIVKILAEQIKREALAPHLGAAEGLRAALLGALGVGLLSALTYAAAGLTLVADIVRARRMYQEDDG